MGNSRDPNSIVPDSLSGTEARVPVIGERTAVEYWLAGWGCSGLAKTHGIAPTLRPIEST